MTPRPVMCPVARGLSLAAMAALLAGCAGFSPDGGFEAVRQLSAERVGQAPRRIVSDEAARMVQARLDELLREPLGVEAAVEVALLNNAGLRADLEELGIAEADLVAAGRLRNPVFSFLNVSSDAGYKIERSLVFDLMGLLSMPRRSALAQARFEQVQTQAALAAVAVADEARRAWIGAVASAQRARYAQQVMEAAEASAELARRMVRAGNFSRLAQMREQSFYADAAAELARARHQVVADRERLVRVLGLWGGRLDFRLAERLPDLPDVMVAPRDAERLALERRLDVRAARQANEATARALGLTRVTRVIDGFELGYANLSEGGEPRRNGYELSFEVPLFDWGGSRLARAQAQYMQSVQRSVQVAIVARSQVRTAWSAYHTAHDLARHFRDERVPLARRISEETLLRYNGMLVGTFELLADARDQVRAVSGAVDALRDFWLADSDLRNALHGGAH